MIRERTITAVKAVVGHIRCLTSSNNSLISSFRTHTCGDLKINAVGEKVKLSGWVHALRKFGPLTFLSLRDKYGATQFVFNEETSKDLFAQVSTVRPESIVTITGKVCARPENMKNPKMATGEIEVAAQSLEIVNRSLTPPINANDGDNSNEKIRLRYRYIDLRRQYLQRNLLLRSNVAMAARNYLCSKGFVEIETPTLFKSTPEGAREFLVPTRIKRSFFALTQSPQQYKQLLMIGGLDRYFQIARCYRDEGGRADRQPEFTQIDLELSFTDIKQIMSIIEDLVVTVWDSAKKSRDLLPCNDTISADFPSLNPISLPIDRMTYQEAMESYGTDKPDVRYDMKLQNLTEILSETTFSPFQVVISSHGKILGFNAKKLAEKDFSRKDYENLQNEASKIGKDITLVQIKNGKWKSPITKKMNDKEIKEISNLLQAEEGDILVLSGGQNFAPNIALGRLRQHCAQLLFKKGYLVKELNSSNFRLLWVVDFPLFEFDSHTGLSSCHHPFTAPHPDDQDALHELLKESELDLSPHSTTLEQLLAIKGQNFDLVCNGWELGGGSIRIHSALLQSQILDRLLDTSKKTKNNFSHLIEGLTYGCPPHGGIALGLDRLVALLCGASSLRDVIAFPKSTTGHELMTDSPAPVTPEQLKEYHIKIA